MIQYICANCGSLSLISDYFQVNEDLVPSLEKQKELSTTTTDGKLNFCPTPNCQDTIAICRSKTSSEVVKTYTFGIHEHLPPLTTTRLPTEASTKFLIQLHEEIHGTNSPILSAYGRYSNKEFWFHVLATADVNAFSYSTPKQEFFLSISRNREQNPFNKLEELKLKYPEEDFSKIEEQLKFQEIKIVQYILNQHP